MSICKFWIVGNLTRDPVQSTTPSGKTRASYTVAVNDIEHDAEGKKHESVSFFPVSVVGIQAENDLKYLRKGSQVAIEGNMKSWRDEAKSRSGHYFNATTVQYLGGGRSGDAATPPAEQPPAGATGHDDWVSDYQMAEPGRR